jgi:hypothetical protein
MFFAAAQNCVFAGSDFPYYQYKYYLSGKPAVVNVIILDEDNPYGVKVSFGDKKMHKLDTVENISRCAVAGVNAQYFKPDTGLPLGLSIVDAKLITGPILKRSAFGVTPDEEYKIAEVELSGNVCFSKDSIPLSNINQPILSKNGAYVYTNQWEK